MNRSKIILACVSLVGSLLLASCAATPGSVGMRNRVESRKRVEAHKSQLDLEQAYRAYRTGQFEKALKMAEQGRLRVPDNPAPYMLMARICLEMGRLETCERLLGEALKINENIPDAHYLRGVVFQRWSRDEQALDAYMTAWNLDPSSIESVHYLLASGEMLVDMGKYRQARELLQPKLPYFENSAAMHHLLGTVSVLLNEHNVAIRHFEQACLIGGTDEIVTSDLARAQLSADRFRECLRSLEKLEISMEDETPSWVYRLRARCYHEMGSPRDARSAYAQLLRVDPEDISAWIEYGATVHQIGDMKRLETCADRLMALAPGRCEGYLYKGLVAYEFGRLDAAQVWMERSVDMAPSHETIPSLALARVEILRGNEQSAFKRCQQILLEHPSDVLAQELANKLATGSLDAMPD